jgi:hypothetical protein
MRAAYPSRGFSEGATDFFLHQRQTFLDKVASGVDNMISLQALIDYVRDYFDDVST